MIPHEKYLRVKSLLGSGHSQRNVAELVGVSRETVRKIKGEDVERREALADGIEYFEFGSREYGRCPICGGRVKMPCLRCQLVGVVCVAGVCGPIAENLSFRSTFRLNATERHLEGFPAIWLLGQYWRFSEDRQNGTPDS